MANFIITAIYDKKSKTIGKPIFQKNKEEAIQGLKDALNSIDQFGKYLMQQHREHPEDYVLIKIGEYIDCKEEIIFTEKNGKLEKELKTHDINFLQSEEEEIIEFKDIELREEKIKVDAETIYSYCKHAMDKIGQEVADYKIMYAEFMKNFDTKMEVQKEIIKEIVKSELKKEQNNEQPKLD